MATTGAVILMSEENFGGSTSRDSVLRKSPAEAVVMVREQAQTFKKPDFKFSVKQSKGR